MATAVLLASSVGGSAFANDPDEIAHLVDVLSVLGAFVVYVALVFIGR